MEGGRWKVDGCQDEDIQYVGTAGADWEHKTMYGGKEKIQSLPP